MNPTVPMLLDLKRLRACLCLGLLWLGGLGPVVSCADAERPAGAHGPGLVILSDVQGQFPYQHDFGKVRYGQRVAHTFVVHNGDELPVVVQSIQTACHCTQVRGIVVENPDGSEIEGNLDAEPSIVTIPPGAKLRLTLGVDTGILLMPNATKLTIVRMRTDSSTTPFLTFEVSVTPQKLFELSPPEVRLNEVPLNHGQASVVRILRGSPEFLGSVLSVKSSGEHVEASLSKEYHFDDPVWTLNLAIQPGDTLGPFRDEVVLMTTDDEGNEDDGAQRELPIPIHGRYVEDIRLYPAVLSFGSLPRGEPGLVDAFLKALVPGARVNVVRAEVLGDAAGHIQVECVPRAANTQGRSPLWDVLLSTDGGLPIGPFQGRLLLHLDDAGQPIIERSFRGEIVPG